MELSSLGSLFERTVRVVFNFLCIFYQMNQSRCLTELVKKIFFTPFYCLFNRRLTARGKMILSKAQNIFMPANIISTVLLLRR